MHEELGFNFLTIVNVEELPEGSYYRVTIKNNVVQIICAGRNMKKQETKISSQKINADADKRQIDLLVINFYERNNKCN